jgi:hypothetical protein
MRASSPTSSTPWCPISVSRETLAPMASACCGTCSFRRSEPVATGAMLTLGVPSAPGRNDDSGRIETIPNESPCRGGSGVVLSIRCPRRRPAGAAGCSDPGSGSDLRSRSHARSRATRSAAARSCPTAADATSTLGCGSRSASGPRVGVSSLTPAFLVTGSAAWPDNDTPTSRLASSRWSARPDSPPGRPRRVGRFVGGRDGVGTPSEEPEWLGAPLAPRSSGEPDPCDDGTAAESMRPRRGTLDAATAAES